MEYAAGPLRRLAHVRAWFNEFQARQWGISHVLSVIERAYNSVSRETLPSRLLLDGWGMSRRCFSGELSWLCTAAVIWSVTILLSRKLSSGGEGPERCIGMVELYSDQVLLLV